MQKIRIKLSLFLIFFYLIGLPESICASFPEHSSDISPEVKSTHIKRHLDGCLFYDIFLVLGRTDF